ARAVEHDRPGHDRSPPVAIGREPAGDASDGGGAERDAERERVIHVGKVEILGDGADQKRVEDEIVEIERPAGEGEQKDAPASRRGARRFAKQHQRRGGGGSDGLRCSRISSMRKRTSFRKGGWVNTQKRSSRTARTISAATSSGGMPDSTIVRKRSPAAARSAMRGLTQPGQR